VKFPIQNLLSKRVFGSKEDRLAETVKTFSPTEKLIFWVFMGILFIALIGLLAQVNKKFLVEVPDYGGSLKEGILGSPRFVNPLLAISDADKDLVSLLYSGLVKVTSDGSFVPDLAESFSISEDGLVYTFILRENARFHDGTQVTTDDVEFTVARAQDAGLKSPKRANWDGVTLEKISEREINFVLKQAYAPFLENLTLGILPKHLWKNLTIDEFAFSEYNIEPVGSGPYEIYSIEKSSSGVPNKYLLKAFDHYALGEPFITEISLNFYGSELDLVSSLEDGDIESASGISAKGAATIERTNLLTRETVLPRVFGIFFNQNQAHLFTNKEVREALNVALDKERIVNEVLFGYGVVIDGPIPPLEKTSQANSTSTKNRLADAMEILADAGWEANEETGVLEKKTKQENFSLSFSITTSDVPELKRVAELIQADWQALGADIDLEIFETGDLNQNVIRPRKYDALFFGEIVGRDLDLYPFWHSSQRNDPGLNIALYVNSTADDILEEARATQDMEKRVAEYKKFEEVLKKDIPAVFVYSPSFIYYVPEKIRNLKLGQLTIPGERFSNIHEWYTETDHIWKIFNKQ
jgi:peptide/nickel transport system substrate-binding protein